MSKRHKAKRHEKIDKRIKEKKARMKNESKERRRWRLKQDQIHEADRNSPYACRCKICSIKRTKNADAEGTVQLMRA